MIVDGEIMISIFEKNSLLDDLNRLANVAHATFA